MSFTLVHVAQGSEMWHAARIGNLTASRADDAFATLKNGEPARSRVQYVVQLALERITKAPQEDRFLAPDMRRGIELEPTARRLYEALTGNVVITSGFLKHPTLAAGCSLDGHVGRMTGIVELKAPRVANHLDYLRASKMPAEYRYQVTHELWISGAEWADFVSYCPQFPTELQLCIRRIARTDVDLKVYEAAVRKFLAEVDLEEAAIRTMADTMGTLQRVVA